MRSAPGRPDVLIFAAVVALLAIGIMMVMSAASVTGFIQYGDPYYHLKRQLVWALVGLAAMAVLAHIDYRFYRLLTVPLLLVAFVGLVVVLFVGAEIGGARRWIGLGAFNVQPSEVMKVALVNYLAAHAAARRGEMADFVRGFLPPLLVLGAAFGLVLLEPDFGTGVAMAVTAFIVLFAAGVNLWHLAGVALASVPALALLIYQEPYRLRRFMAFLDPWADRMDAGWNVIQSLLAIGSGGLFGLGLGEGRQKYLYVPEQHTDFIFAILGEELGFVGTTTVVALFLLLAWRGYRAALRAPDVYGCLLAVGITTMIVFQALLNIGVVTGSLPATGITLPFISFGGSSLVVTLSAAGILLNISRHGTRA
ncbi:MAG TPA: putative lipid II flippase FtsW [Limnochordales bacterium]|nr:putative lipid II flippase FtsW [Limnochordales bacterium]